MAYKIKLDKANSINELYKLVQIIVLEHIGKVKEDIDIEFRNLGFTRDGYIGGLYSYYNNTITINAAPFYQILRQNKRLAKYHLFYVLLHEYVHAIGVNNEEKTREITQNICEERFGDNHTLTKMARHAYNSIMPQMPVYRKKDIFKEDFLDDFFTEIEKMFDGAFEEFFGKRYFYETV